MKTTDQERAEFEREMAAIFTHTDFEVAPEGHYKNPITGTWLLIWHAARRAPAAPVTHVTDEMIEAANEAYCPFGDMHLAIQAALAAAPQPPEAEQCPSCRTGSPYACTCTFKTQRNSDPSCFEPVPVQLPEPQAEIEVRSMKTYLDLNIHEWRDTLPDGEYKVYTEQQVRDLLAAHGIGKDKA